MPLAPQRSPPRPLATPATMPERCTPHDLPPAQLLYALARHVLAGREHRYRQETNGSAEVAVGRIRFVVEVDSIRFWGHDVAWGRGRAWVGERHWS